MSDLKSEMTALAAAGTPRPRTRADELRQAAGFVGRAMAGMNLTVHQCEACHLNSYQNWQQAQRHRELDAIRKKLLRYAAEAENEREAVPVSPARQELGAGGPSGSGGTPTTSGGGSLAAGIGDSTSEEDAE